MSNVAAPATAELLDSPMQSLALEIRDSAINVDEIMARIRRSIAEKKKARSYRPDALLSQGIEALRLEQGNPTLEDHLTILGHAARLDLEGEPIASHRPLTGFAIKWIKRLTRFWIRKYTDGPLSRQNHFNCEVVTALAEMNRKIEELEAENERLKTELAEKRL